MNEIIYKFFTYDMVLHMCNIELQQITDTSTMPRSKLEKYLIPLTDIVEKIFIQYFIHFIDY